MKTPPDGFVPAEMPKDLDRVYATLDAPIAPAPEALLERILASRAGGERRILPADHAPPSRRRVRLLRGAIAAALGLVALGMWAQMSRRHTDTPKAPKTAGFGFPMGGDFGFGELALAQGTQEPKFPPMTFDVARLHPVQVTYIRRLYDNGKPDGADTVAYALTQSSGPGREWILTMARAMTDSRHSTAYVTDSVRMDGTTLQTLSETYRVLLPDSGSAYYRWTLSDTTSAMHAVYRDVRYRPVPGGKERAGIDTHITDTVYRLPSSRYPRLTTAMTYGGEVLVKLMAAPMGSGWKRSMVTTPPGGTMIKEGVTQMTISMDLELVGDERVDSPAGKVDCWKVRRHGTSAESTYRIRKRDGVLISLRIQGKSGGRTFVSEMELIGEQ